MLDIESCEQEFILALQIHVLSLLLFIFVGLHVSRVESKRNQLPKRDEQLLPSACAFRTTLVQCKRFLVYVIV